MNVNIITTFIYYNERVFILWCSSSCSTYYAELICTWASCIYSSSDTLLSRPFGDSPRRFSLTFSLLSASYRCNELCTRSYPLHRNAMQENQLWTHTDSGHFLSDFSWWAAVERGVGGGTGKWGWGNNWGRRECASPVINASTHRVKWRQMVCLSWVHCLFIHQIVLLPLLIAVAAVGQIHTHSHTYTSGNAFKQKFMKGKRDSRKRKHLIGLVFNQNKNVGLLQIELKLMIWD